MMKYTTAFTIFLMLLFTSCATHTSFNDFYQSNQKASDLSLGVNASLIRGFLNGEDYDEIKPLLKKAKHIRILVFEENAQDMTLKFNKFIRRSNFDELVSIKDDGDRIRIYTLQDQDKIREVVLNIGTGDELLLLGLKTNLDQEDIGKLMNQIDVN
jgi:hypothetical protein